MTSPGEYRRRAEECVQLAQTARPSHRKSLLEIAAAWIKLADNAEGEAKLLKDDGQKQSVD
jgi:hypothetical protein